MAPCSPSSHPRFPCPIATPRLLRSGQLSPPPQFHFFSKSIYNLSRSRSRPCSLQPSPSQLPPPPPPQRGQPQPRREEHQQSSGRSKRNRNRMQAMDDDIDSSCSTPFASAPSSPGRPHGIGGGGGGYFFSAPASPIHHLLLSASCSASATPNGGGGGRGCAGDAEFEFGGPGGPMISADELFHNGQIRPLTLPPLPDLDPGSDDDDNDDDHRRPTRGRDLTPRSASVHRRARSMSPLRSASPRLKLINALVPAPDLGPCPGPAPDAATGGTTHGVEAAPPVTASSRSSSSSSTSSSSSSGTSSSARGSRRWVFLRDMLLHRSKSEPSSSSSSSSAHSRDASGPGATPAAAAAKPERAWSFSPAWVARERLAARLRPSSRAQPAAEAGSEDARPRAQGRGRRRRSTTVAAAHERLYAAPNRAQAEEMRRRTFLPYRQGLLGCLGFSSRGYGALHGLTKTLNPVFSR